LIRVPRRTQIVHSDLHIRRGTLSDAPVLSAFAARTFTETFGAENQPEDLRAHLEASYGVVQQSRELGDPDVATLMAYANGAFVAYAQVRRKAAPACVTQESPIELHRFYVDRPAHGSGVAQRLMAAVFDQARAFGGRHVWLGVWERNPRAMTFYRKFGFVDIGSADFFVGSDRQTDRILVTALPAS